MSTRGGAERQAKAVEDLRRANWRELTPILLCSAGRTLRAAGLAEGRDHRPSTLEARELLHEAVTLLLSGTRGWPSGIGTTRPQIIAVVRTVMRNLVFQTGTRARRTVPAGGLEDEAEDTCTASVRFAARARLDGVEAALADDPEAQAVLAAMAKGHIEQGEIAAALGWTVERAKVVRKRMSRRLSALRPASEPPPSEPAPASAAE